LFQQVNFRLLISYAMGSICLSQLIIFISGIQVPVQFTSQQTVEELALLAYNRALKLSKPGINFFIESSYKTLLYVFIPCSLNGTKRGRKPLV